MLKTNYFLKEYVTTTRNLPNISLYRSNQINILIIAYPLIE